MNEVVIIPFCPHPCLIALFFSAELLNWKWRQCERAVVQQSSVLGGGGCGGAFCWLLGTCPWPAFIPTFLARGLLFRSCWHFLKILEFSAVVAAVPQWERCWFCRPEMWIGMVAVSGCCPVAEDRDRSRSRRCFLGPSCRPVLCLRHSRALALMALLQLGKSELMIFS